MLQFLLVHYSLNVCIFSSRDPRLIHIGKASTNLCLTSIWNPPNEFDELFKENNKLPPEKKEKLIQFMNCFKDYLCKTTHETDFEKARHADQQLFNSAIHKFKNKLTKRKKGNNKTTAVRVKIIEEYCKKYPKKKMPQENLGIFAKHKKGKLLKHNKALRRNMNQ